MATDLVAIDLGLVVEPFRGAVIDGHLEVVHQVLLINLLAYDFAFVKNHPVTIRLTGTALMAC